MNEPIVTILAKCLQMIEQGTASPEDCLTLYPDLREELEPLLNTALGLTSAPPVQPSETFRKVARQRLVNRISMRQRVTFQASPRLYRQKKPKIKRRFAMSWVLIITLIATLLGGGGVAYASSNSLPGDMLYPVKTTLEDTRLLLASDEADIDLLLQFTDERIEEIEKLSELGRFEDLPVAAQALEQRMSELALAMAKAEPGSPERAAAHAALVQAAISKHIQVLNRVMENVPDMAKQGIQHAIDASSKMKDKVKGPPEGKPGQGPPEDKPGQGPPDDKPGQGPPTDKPGQGHSTDMPGQSFPTEMPMPGEGTPQGTPMNNNGQGMMETPGQGSEGSGNTGGMPGGNQPAIGPQGNQPSLFSMFSIENLLWMGGPQTNRQGKGQP